MTDTPEVERAMTDTPDEEVESPTLIVLDDVDQAIIRELQKDGRRTYGRIADSIGLTEAPTRQRVWRLTRGKAIEIVAITNPIALGFRLRAAIGIRVSGSLDVVVSALADIDELDWLVSTAGAFDLWAEVRCRDERHLYDVLTQQVRRAHGVAGTEVFIYLRGFKAAYPWPPGSGRRTDERSAQPSSQARGAASSDDEPSVRLDDVDLAIIRELQADGRQAYGRIAKTVGLGLGTTRQRITRLVDNDVIRIAAIIDPRIGGFRLRATIGLTCQGDVSATLDSLESLDEVESLVAVAGAFDLIAEVQCRDASHLSKLLGHSIRTIDGVVRVETLVFLQIFKVRYAWPATHIR